MRQKKREEQRQNAHNERFRIVNCSRTTTTEEGGSHTATTSTSATDPAKEITILDIEKDSGAVTRSGPGIAELSVDQSLGGSSVASSSRREDTEYVYDLYVPEVGQPELEWSEQFLENMLRFVPVDEEIHLTFSYTYF